MSDNVLEQLKDIKNEIKIKLSSKDNTVNFTPLTLKQQKDILDNLSNSATTIITFFNNTTKIIKENIQEDVTLYVVDRPNILISLRNNIDNNYNGIDLSKLVEKNKKIKILDSDTTIETKDFSFKVKIPTLDKDIKVNEFLIKNYKDENTIIGKLYVNEVVKFIESITIKETGTIIDFNELPIKKLFEITENIESHNFKKIYEFIQVVRNYEKDLVTLDDVQVDIGPELFVL